MSTGTIIDNAKKMISLKVGELFTLVFDPMLTTSPDEVEMYTYPDRKLDVLTEGMIGVVLHKPHDLIVQANGVIRSNGQSSDTIKDNRFFYAIVLINGKKYTTFVTEMKQLSMSARKTHGNNCGKKKKVS